jgi:replicative DNA helicase
MPLHQALATIAARQGFASWSLLMAKAAETAPAGRLFAQLSGGDLVLIGARPGHGKTLMSLELAVEAMKASRRCVFFSLEYTHEDVLDRFRAIGAEPARFDSLFTFDNSDAICADYIVRALESETRGTLAVIDYLQLLDQRRENPDLMTQVRALKAFARDRGFILVFISQIHRSFDQTKKACPGIGDVRLPNPLDLSLFDKACFLHNGDIRFHAVN